MLLVLLIPVVAQAAVKFPLKAGSTGKDVLRIQKILCDHGYVLKQDGVYSTATEYYVKQYQKAHGLYADGKVGIYTWYSMTATKRDRYNIDLLSKLIMREAGGSGDRGQLAVANVAMNYARKAHRTIEAEIKSGRYSPARNWSRFMRTRPTARCRANALRAYFGGEKAFSGVQPYYFHDHEWTPKEGSWRTKLTCLGEVGDNIFYGAK